MSVVREALETLRAEARLAGDDSRVERIDVALASLTSTTDQTSSRSLESALASFEPSPLLPSLLDGALPKQTATNAVIRVKDVIRKSVRSVKNNSLVVSEVDGVELVLTARSSDGSILPMGADGRIVITRGDGMSVTGSGFASGSLASGWLFSEPMHLGNVTVDQDGNFSASVDIGGGVPVGVHTAQVHGIGGDGLERTVDVGIAVIDQVTGGTSDSASETNPMSGISDGNFGSNVAGGVLAAGAVAVFLALWYVVSRRRRRASDNNQTERDTPVV
jgi:hypothetical protein